MSQKGYLIRLVIVKAPKMDPEFEKTYRDHYPKLFRIAAKMLQDPEGAKDVVQDVFTAYYFAMSNEKVIRDTKNWLVRSTINKGIDYKRKTARTVTMEKPICETGEQTLDEASDILNAITHLNEKEQTLVVLYSEGYSYKEIAEMTGRNLPSIGKTLSRIMEKIKNHLL
jgi:RNA polymerase sigma-70 factor (ECF subfamily)